MKHWPQPVLDLQTGKTTSSCKHCGSAIELVGGPGTWTHTAHLEFRRQQEAEKEAKKNSTKK